MTCTLFAAVKTHKLDSKYSTKQQKCMFSQSAGAQGGPLCNWKGPWAQGCCPFCPPARSETGDITLFPGMLLIDFNVV